MHKKFCCLRGRRKRGDKGDLGAIFHLQKREQKQTIFSTAPPPPNFFDLPPPLQLYFSSAWVRQQNIFLRTSYYLLIKPFFSDHRMDWNSYHRLNSIYDYLHYLQRHYPNVAEVIEIGKSVQERPMFVMKIGSKKSAYKPAIFIEAGK